MGMGCIEPGHMTRTAHMHMYDHFQPRCGLHLIVHLLCHACQDLLACMHIHTSDP